MEKIWESRKEFFTKKGLDVVSVKDVNVVNVVEAVLKPYESCTLCL